MIPPMYHGNDRCTHCGGALEQPEYGYIHFCSQRCRRNAITKFLPTHFSFSDYDHPNRDTFILQAERRYQQQVEVDIARQHAEAAKKEDAEREKHRRVVADIIAETEAHTAKLKAEIAQEQELLRERPIPAHVRFEHTHILGPSGSGKTQLLQQLILRDLI